MAEQRVHLHWGEGVVAEEVRLPTQYHVAVLQLIQMDDGTELMRCCWYDHAGRFHRSPLIVDPDTWAALVASARTAAPRLYAHLTREAAPSTGTGEGPLPPRSGGRP